MKKKLLNWSLVAVMLCGTGLSFTACSDDDDDEKSEQRMADADPLDTDEARVAWRWLNELTDETELSTIWNMKTYEVTAGQPSEQNKLVRIFVVENLAEAQQAFSLLADEDPDELGSTLTVNGGTAGTMTWKLSAEGAKNLAEVTVSSRLFPGLQKIVYCTRDQIGDNGLFTDAMRGTAYYRFGDVIKDDEGYYWVCARPSFAPNKAKSHWINIFNASLSGGSKKIPEGNLQKKWDGLDKYNKQTIILPTKLSYNREAMWNLANLIWAMLKPGEYKDYILMDGYGSLGGFGYDYHGEKFLKAVAAYWDIPDNSGYTIWQKLFNATHDEMTRLQGLSFFYQGYSWTIGNSGYLWRYAQNSYKTQYMDDESDDKEKVNFVNDGIDINYYASTPGAKALPFELHSKQSGWSGTWVVRHKTGAQLMTAGSYSPYAKIRSKKGEMEDVYRFNGMRNIPAGEKVPQLKEDSIASMNAISKAQATPGCVIGNDGKFYTSELAATANGVKAVAMVVYVGNDADASGNYHGLACSFVEGTKLTWATSRDNVCIGESKSSEWQEQNDGIRRTELLATDGHEHPAAQWAHNLTVDGFNPTAYGFSHWFIPTVGQYMKMLNGMGARCLYDDDTYKVYGYDEAIKRFMSMGNNTFRYNMGIWTSSERNKSTAVYLIINSSSTSFVNYHNKDVTDLADVRPFIAF